MIWFVWCDPLDYKKEPFSQSYSIPFRQALGNPVRIARRTFLKNKSKRNWRPEIRGWECRIGETIVHFYFSRTHIQPFILLRGQYTVKVTNGKSYGVNDSGDLAGFHGFITYGSCILLAPESLPSGLRPRILLPPHPSWQKSRYYLQRISPLLSFRKGRRLDSTDLHVRRALMGVHRDSDSDILRVSKKKRKTKNKELWKYTIRRGSDRRFIKIIQAI